MVGKTLAHYEIVERIGAGGMGEVYRARDQKLQRDVAIKVLPEEMASDGEKRSRFEREALAVAALKHPNVVTIYGVDEAERCHFIVMELVEGTTLTNAIPPAGLPLDRFFEVALALTDALSAAHDRGITHRDLKPANVMLDEAGRVKVLDFGLAKFWEPVGSDAGMTMPADAETRGGQILGTAAYMSPEQAQGKPVDVRSDVFSLGVMLYEMATGKRPFEGDTNISVISSVLKDEPSSATTINPKLPRHLARIIAHCLVKDPERRYQSAKELRNELDGLKREIDTGELQAPVAGPLAGRPVGRLVVLSAVTVAIVLAIFFVIRRDSPPGFTSPSSSDTETTIVGVIGFQNLSDPSDSDNLGRMLVALVTTHLAESGRVAVASMPRVLEALEREQPSGPFDPKVAPDAARGAGVSLMVVGQVGKLGEGLILTAELIDVESGETLGSHQERGDSTEDLFTMAGTMAERLSELAPGRGEKRGASVDLAEVLTTSPEAYRHYVAGELALNHSEYERSLQHLRRAIAADSSFALAYYRAAVASWWTFSGDEDMASSLLDRGLPHADRLPDRWRSIYLALRDYLSTRYESAEAALSELVEAGVDIPDAYYLLGEVQTHTEKFLDLGAARKNFARALALDPTFRVVSFHLIEGYLQTRDLEAGERLLRQLEEGGPDDPGRLEVEALLRLAQGRNDEAVAVAQRLRELSGDRGELGRARWVLPRAGRFDLAIELADVGKTSSEAYLAVVFDQSGDAYATHGRLREAADDWRRAGQEFRGTGGQAQSAAAVLTKCAVALGLLGEHEAAEEAALEAIRRERLSRSAHCLLGWVRLRSGDVAGAEDALAQLEGVVPEIEAPHADYWGVILRAELLLAAGHPEEARAELVPLSALPPEYRDFQWEYLLRGRVLEALDDLDAAVAAYEETLHPITVAISNTPLRELCLYHLARAEESAGRTDSARTHYEEFLQLWSEADSELTQVEDARERLARLAE